MTYRDMVEVWNAGDQLDSDKQKVSDRLCRMHIPISESREQFHSSKLTQILSSAFPTYRPNIQEMN